MKDKHIMEALGKSIVTIEDGKVTSVSDPLIDYCPLFNKYRKIEKLNKESIKENMEYRIKSFGMCTPERQLRMKDMLSVGISEILHTNVKLHKLDCVVGACDGAGTVILTDPELIQGVGGRVSGLISTTPIENIINTLGKENVIDKKNASLNPIEGIYTAIDRGFKEIAVTLIPSCTIKDIRELKLPSDVNIYLFIAHTTNATKKETKMIFKYSDIITSCASKNIREYALIKKPYYYGSKIPIYANTSKAKEFLDTRLKYINKPLSTNVYKDFDDIPKPLV